MHKNILLLSILFSFSAHANDELDQFFSDFPRQVQVTKSECDIRGTHAGSLRLDYFGVERNARNEWVIVLTALPGPSARRTLSKNVTYEISATQTGKRIDTRGRGPDISVILEGKIPTLIISYPLGSGQLTKDCSWTGTPLKSRR